MEIQDRQTNFDAHQRTTFLTRTSIGISKSERHPFTFNGQNVDVLVVIDDDAETSETTISSALTQINTKHDNLYGSDN